MPCTEKSERIAIVGVGGIFPGAPDLNRFWHNISHGIDAGRTVPDGRWYLSAAKAFAPWPPQPDRVYSTWGCFIEDFSFDPEGLNIDPDLLTRLDPMFHLGLHAARAAYRDASMLRGVDHSRVGVILGNIALPTESTSAICRDVLGRTFVEKLIDVAAEAARNRESVDRSCSTDFACTKLADPKFVATLKSSLHRSDWHPLNRFAAGLPSSLIAQGLGLGGIAYTLDAACASSLYSLKFASEELLAHRADAMLAGGMSRPDCQYTQMGFAQLQALSRRGCCAPLSAQADGLVVGEGAGVFVLKRLSDAVAAGDHIYGVIAGIGLSNDRGANLLAPHSDGQLRAMRAAYELAGWNPSDVDLIECHATGTPVGDSVEISSLHQLWENESARPQQCVIGGVKSNVGHLLTGAGAAGLMKVLLALKHQMLPPTANFKQPAAGLASPDSPFRVLSRSEPWNRRTEARLSATVTGSSIPRRGTINAFGFGGINAHVLIEEWNDNSVLNGGQSRQPAISAHRAVDCADSSQVRIAIVGVDAHMADLDSKQAVQENEIANLPQGRIPLNWWGAEQSDWFRRENNPANDADVALGTNQAIGHGINEVRLPMGRFRIPPLEMQDMLPQQQLMLKVAAGAISDSSATQPAGTEGEFSVARRSASRIHDAEHRATLDSASHSNRTGVFVGIELDPNTTNFHFRWAIEQDAPGWAEMLGLNLTSEELSEWINQLKDAAGPPLSPNRVMGNLGGIVASRLAREFDVGGPSFTISCGGDSGQIAFGLAAQFLQRGELDTAIVGAVDFASDVRTVTRGNERSVDRQADSLPKDTAIGFVLRRHDDALERNDRIYAISSLVEGRESNDSNEPEKLARPFLDERSTLTMESLLRATFAAYHRHDGMTPRLRDRMNPQMPQPLSVLSPVAELARVRAAATNSEFLRIQLRTRVESEDQPLTSLMAAERFGRPGDHATGLFAVSGESEADFVAALEDLDHFSQSFANVEELARLWHCRREFRVNDRIVAAFVAADQNELKQAFDGLKLWMKSGGRSEYFLGRHVFASASQKDRGGKLAFVFPGSGSGFPGMGRELLVAFPEVLDQQHHENQSLERQYRSGLIWSREAFPQLLLDHKAMIFSQVAIGTSVCDLLALFGVIPSASIGYSLGESSALFGLRAWTDRDEMLQRMERSPLFGSDLVAPFDAARNAWNVPDDQAVPWISGVIDRSATDVRQAMESFQSEGLKESTGEALRLYLLIVNTARQCVVGGDRVQVNRLVRELDAKFIPLASPSSVHCSVLCQVEEAYRQLHLMRTTVPMRNAQNENQNSEPLQPIRFYSTAWGRTYDVTQTSACEAIVAQAVDTIDFPRVIEQAYSDGVRLFVEIGPGSNCTKMIDEILSDRPHLARSALPRTSRSLESFYELLAALIAERVPVNLSYLYGPRTSDVGKGTQTASPRDVVTTVGGLPFSIPAPSSGWQFSVIQTTVPPVQTPSDLAESSVSIPESESATFDEMSFHEEATSDDAWGATIGAGPVQKPLDHLRVGDGRVVNAATAENVELSPSTSLNLMDQFQLMMDQRTQAHEVFLRFSSKLEHLAAEQLALLAQAGAQTAERALQKSPLSEQVQRIDHPNPASPDHDSALPHNSHDSHNSNDSRSTLPTPGPVNQQTQVRSISIPDEPPTSLTREQCMEFAVGKIGLVLGRRFAEIDQYPTRVRLPDEPLMLVDRILKIEGDPLSMTSGRVVTEHDIHPGAWYLDCERIPTCIAVESGQADLFLSGWLGIDLQTKGVACYRLLDAVVTFHDALPQAGKVIHYDIRVLHFFRQGDTYLFRFEFDATVDGQPLLTMREGCAGFFTDAELAGGKGIIHTALDKRPRPGVRPADWSDPVPLAVESYDDSQVLALRQGDLAACFGPAFAGVPLSNPVTIPGLLPSSGSDVTRSRMWLIDRVLKLDPVGGKFGMGTILGELDIHPDDWFLTCHFCDDQVMPGTLMYECCLHTLRIYLLRMGWIGEAGQIAYEPIPGIRSRLKCRGQVLAGTKKVWYEITLKELGYGRQENRDEQKVTSHEALTASTHSSSLVTHHSSLSSDAYCLADALMYADGKPIVEITDMSVRLTGLTRDAVERLWSASSSRGSQHEGTPAASSSWYDRRPAIFDTDRITAFAIGKPSDAFGDRYRIFDEERKIARLPGPPFQFLDRIVSIENCQQWVLQPGGEIIAQYDVPVDAWYFASNRQPTMPFAVLLETALQPCGWLAGYLGSALTSNIDVSFRNLGGSAIQYRDVTPQSGTLTTTVKMTRVSNSAGMIIQHYDFDLRCDDQPVYVGNTYFGFFAKAALANQIGIRDAGVYEPTAEDRAKAKRGPYPQAAPFPDQDFRMIRTIECLVPSGGPFGMGCIVGTMPVDPSAWFFKAHFYQDPVVPGSLGLESFWQLLKVYATDRWRLGSDTRFSIPSLVPARSSTTPPKHEWVYRGQVVPKDKLVTVTAVIKNVDDVQKILTAEGFLSVDGRVIYQMKDFTLGIV